MPTWTGAIVDVFCERTFHMKTLAFTIRGFPDFFSIFKDSPLREMLRPQIIAQMTRTMNGVSETAMTITQRLK